MSAAIDVIFAQGIEAIQSAGHRRTFKVIASRTTTVGTVFDGTLVVAAVIDPEAPAGQDVRESVTLYVLAPGPQPPLESGDRLLEGAIQWKILSREDNPADVEVKYTLQKVLARDQG